MCLEVAEGLLDRVEVQIVRGTIEFGRRSQVVVTD
jgi:hypothetical protein